MDALIVVILNLFLSAVIPSFALPAAINISRIVPLKCLLNYSAVLTALSFLL